jgi:hypothetical protein
MRISTGVTLLFILAVAILPGLIGNGGRTTYDVGVFGDHADELADRLPAVAALAFDSVAVHVRRMAGAGEAERLVRRRSRRRRRGRAGERPQGAGRPARSPRRRG